MIENNDKQNSLENHESVTDLYADTVPEKEGKNIWDRVKNIISPKNKAEQVSYSFGEADFEDTLFDEIPGGRCAALSFILGDHKRGNIDIERYKSFLTKSFQKEKMIFPEGDARLYFLIQGIASGVIPFKNTLDIISSHMEYTEFFIDQLSWKKDGCIVDKGTPGAEQRGWGTEDVKVWKKFINPTREDGFFQEVVSSGLKKFNEEFIQKSECVQHRQKKTEAMKKKDSATL
jgi:hypothetical protein